MLAGAMPAQNRVATSLGRNKSVSQHAVPLQSQTATIRLSQEAKRNKLDRMNPPRRKPSRCKTGVTASGSQQADRKESSPNELDRTSSHLSLERPRKAMHGFLVSQRRAAPRKRRLLHRQYSAAATRVRNKPRHCPGRNHLIRSRLGCNRPSRKK